MPSNAPLHSSKLEEEGKTFTQEAKDALPAYFKTLSTLDNFASARDVVENVRPHLETARANRAYEKQQLEAKEASAEPASGSGSKGGGAVIETEG